MRDSVDVGNCRDTFTQRKAGFVGHRHQDADDDKTGKVVGMNGTRLKKCAPINRAGSGDACPNRMIGIDDALIARTASAFRILPTSEKIARFISSRSVAVSMTRSDSANADVPETVRMRPNAASRAVPSIFSFLTSRPSALAIAACGRPQAPVPDRKAERDTAPVPRPEQCPRPSVPRR